MSEQNVSKRRRLDHNLYAAEGVVVLGAAIFLCGFIIEKSSNTPGRGLEAAGFVVFAIGLFAAAAISHFLSQHYARTTSERNPTDPSFLADIPRPQFGFLSTRLDPVVRDPATPLVREVQADPENDVTRSRLIEKERFGSADAGPDSSTDQSFTQ